MNSHHFKNRWLNATVYGVILVGVGSIFWVQTGLTSSIESIPVESMMGKMPGMTTAAPMVKNSASEDELGRRFGRFMGSFMDQVDRGRSSEGTSAEMNGSRLAPPSVDAVTPHPSVPRVPAWPPYDPWGLAYPGNPMGGVPYYGYDRPWNRRYGGYYGNRYGHSGMGSGYERGPRGYGYGYGYDDGRDYGWSHRDWRDDSYRDDRWGERGRYKDDRYRWDRSTPYPFDGWGGGWPWDWWSASPW